jgi:hypothetical protein
MHGIIFKLLFCLQFIILIPENVFCQSFDLLLAPEDMRLETFFLDGKIVHSLYIRKKQNVESVMLTEPAGLHALRSMEWNPINGDERRELSGKVIYDDNSRFSILSSTPIPDWQFGRAFQLLIPSRFVYGNKFSSAGVVFIDIDDGVQINIRTFDHKFADPNTGRFQNNVYVINDRNKYYSEPRDEEPAYISAIPMESSLSTDLYILRKELKEITIHWDFLDQRSDNELKAFLRSSIDEEYKKQKKR